MVNASASPAPGRILSIDALRGFDMFWIIGADSFSIALLNLIGTPTALTLAGQFDHSAWNGFTFYDLIYPLFLFIVGASLPFAISRRLEKGHSRRAVVIHILKRFLTIMFLGYLFNGVLDLNFAQLRLTGVLHRIAWCYLITALLMLGARWRGQAVFGAVLLLAYWALMALWPVPGFGAGVYTPEGNFSGYVDRLFLPGVFYGYGYGDFLGILGTLPSIGSTIAGVMAGHLLRSGLTQNKKLQSLIIGGLASLALAWIWNPWLPVNKALWTSSYTLCGAGYSALLLALFYWVIDMRGVSRWAFPFIVIGLNPITIYLAQRLFDFGIIAKIFVHGFIGYMGIFQPAFLALCILAVKWLFLDFLYRQKIFLKA